ncbi:hypothetical protein SJI19_06660 [Acerihabitans sp. TG2]|nr:hypothetical protein [Acerihabitans sp. TG2]MEA9390233.1 hypothetical protein [Acerihabitans sp. TG2]
MTIWLQYFIRFYLSLDGAVFSAVEAMVVESATQRSDDKPGI